MSATTLDPALADQLRAQLDALDDLSIDDIQRRMQWVWKKMLDATREVDRIENELRDVHRTLDRAWDEAYERSMLSQDKRLNAKFHETVANNRCRDQVTLVAGLEAQKRITLRWLRTLDTIHHGLQTHAANCRVLGAA
jgi:hypothetical protein